jgi:hypothetical protein
MSGVTVTVGEVGVCKVGDGASVESSCLQSPTKTVLDQLDLFRTGYGVQTIVAGQMKFCIGKVAITCCHESVCSRIKRQP